MTRRERVMKSLSFEKSGPMDLGGMLSTGISCFNYPRLVKALSLPERRPKVHDTHQMLALPDRDVLDALNCDVATVHLDMWTNAFDEPERWVEYDFNGRLPALVQDKNKFRVNKDNSVSWDKEGREMRMVSSSYVFDDTEGDEAFDMMRIDPPKEDLTELKASLDAKLLTDEQIASITDYCRRAREATDRAILFNGLPMGLRFRNGMASWSMFCLTDPEYVQAVHQLITEHFLENASRLIPAIAPYIDIFMTNSDDQGTQNATILPPDTFRELFVPYYKKMNEKIHDLAPGLKTFLHSCGAIYTIIDDIIESGFDILNPVQWVAGEHSFGDWKDKCRGRIVLWGGGINSQHTLPLGTIEQVRAETREICEYLNEDGGFIFCGIHNILAEIDPRKVVAMYETAGKTLKE